jgi:hypothetical protein
VRLDKGPTRAELTDARRRDLRNEDARENRKVRRRSEGRCEAWIDPDGIGHFARCRFTAREIHHMISGRGRRNVGPSITADHKQHLCNLHHRLITGILGAGKALVRVGGDVPRWTDGYRLSEGAKSLKTLIKEGY